MNKTIQRMRLWRTADGDVCAVHGLNPSSEISTLMTEVLDKENPGEAWAALMRDWLPASGLQLDARPCFEYYPKDAACDPQTGAFECEICIPVVPL